MPKKRFVDPFFGPFPCISAALLLIIAILPSLAAGQDPMTFRIAGSGGSCADCVWTVAEGRITLDTPGEFLAYWERESLQGSHLVAFHSPGGIVLAGLELGRLLRERGARTQVARTAWDGETDPSGTTRWEWLAPGNCSSACVLAFMGGVSRVASDPESQLGFHQFRGVRPDGGETTDQSGEELDYDPSQLLMGIQLEYVLEMGVDPRVLQLAAAVPPGDIYYPSEELLEALGVVTTPGLGRWSLVPFLGRLVARASAGDPRYRVQGVILTCMDRGSMGLAILAPSSHNSFEMFRGDAGIMITLDQHEYRVPSSRILAEEQGGAIMVFALLTTGEAAALLNASSIEVTFDVARVFGFHQTNGSLTEMDRSMMRAVVRDCG